MNLEKFAQRAWYDRRPGILASALSFALLPISWVYALVMRVRRIWYERTATHIRVPVISIGNLPVGGSGKTPTTMFIAETLLRLGRKPAIITRGYKGTAKGAIGLVSDGENLLMDAILAGDEAVMMAGRLKGVPIVLGAKRVAAARYALDRLEIDCLVLDDAYQHLAIARDLNILCVNGATGFGNGRVFPSGPLREPLWAARSADLCLVTSYSEADAPIEQTLRNAGYAGDIIDLPFVLTGFKQLDGQAVSTDAVRGKRVLAFTSIAHPSAFDRSLRSMGIAPVISESFGDHFQYSAKDISKLDALAKGQGFEYYVTTEKDAVKLNDMGRFFSVPILVAIADALPGPEDRTIIEHAIKEA